MKFIHFCLKMLLIVIGMEAFAPSVWAQTTTSDLHVMLRTTYYQTGRAISFPASKLPTRIRAGDQVTWKVEGAAQIRSIQPGSAYGYTFVHTLASDRIPRAVIKATGSGRFNVRLLDSAGRIIFTSRHSFYNMLQLVETAQPANHLPTNG